MTLTANSEVARQTRRKTGNGWHTTFLGENRNTLKQGQTPPEAGSLYPMAFLVEKEPHAVTKPHFHEADQYQVIVQGGGRLGTRRTRGAHARPLDRSWQPTKASPGSPWQHWTGARYSCAAQKLRAAQAE
jgi:hypothetical protein